jgi:outer membrane protein assembly factor BamB
MIKASRFGHDNDYRRIDLDLGKAVRIALPDLPRALEPREFGTPDGRSGWAVRLPGARPIATPAFGDGRLYVGGGFGSHEFFAFNAKTGTLDWQIHTSDDGPTAAVFEEGFVAFNTESCTVFVCEAATGRVVWSEWLGDPLMSQPAIAQGRLFIAYPARGRHGATHRLLCAELRTGRHLWEQEITGDVITAPVVAGDCVYLSCFDGTSFCLACGDGAVVYRRRDGATSAPFVVGDDVFHSRRMTDEGKVYESVHRADAKRGADKDADPFLAAEAEYLKDGHGVGLKGDVLHTLDASVGFGAAPASAKLHEAAAHVGVKTVAGAWAWQGSRAAHAKGRVMNAQGRFVHSFQADAGSGAWRAEARGRGGEQVFAPPSLGKDHLYLCSADGDLVSLRQADGEQVFLYATGQPMTFQPALAEGNVYAGTANGLLVCLRTDGDDADGWYGWGGNAQHNKNA